MYIRLGVVVRECAQIWCGIRVLSSFQQKMDLDLKPLHRIYSSVGGIGDVIGLGTRRLRVSLNG